MDEYFNRYADKKITVNIEDYDSIKFFIGNFMKVSLAEYINIHMQFQEGVIIYRQGISGW